VAAGLLGRQDKIALQQWQRGEKFRPFFI